MNEKDIKEKDIEEIIEEVIEEKKPISPSFNQSINDLKESVHTLNLYKGHQDDKGVKNKGIKNQSKIENINNLKIANKSLRSFGKFIQNNKPVESQVESVILEKFQSALKSIKSIIHLNELHSDHYNSVLFNTNKLTLNFLSELLSSEEYKNYKFQNPETKKMIELEIHRYATMIFFQHAKAFEYSTAIKRAATFSSKNPEWLDQALKICLIGEASKSNIEYLSENYKNDKALFKHRYYISWFILGTDIKENKDFSHLTQDIKTSVKIEAYLPEKDVEEKIDMVSILSNQLDDLHESIELNEYEIKLINKNITFIEENIEEKNKNIAFPIVLFVKEDKLMENEKSFPFLIINVEQNAVKFHHVELEQKSLKNFMILFSSVEKRQKQIKSQIPLINNNKDIFSEKNFLTINSCDFSCDAIKFIYKTVEGKVEINIDDVIFCNNSKENKEIFKYEIQLHQEDKEYLFEISDKQSRILNPNDDNTSHSKTQNTTSQEYKNKLRKNDSESIIEESFTEDSEDDSSQKKELN